MSTQLCQDLRAKKFVGELLGWPGHTKKLGFNVDSAADLEFWSGSSLGVGGWLVLALSFGHVQLKLLVQLVKVSDKNLGTCRCEVTLRVDGNVQMITLVGEEGGNSGGSARGIVVCELG